MTPNGWFTLIEVSLPQIPGALQAFQVEADAALEGVTGADGDVVGPASAVNNRIAVFDGTTGKLLKDGGSTIAEIVAGSGGLVTSVFSRTGNVVAATNDYTFAQIDRTTSSIADLTTRSAGDLSSGTLLAARMPALTGDVTTSAGSVSTTIANNAVTLAKMADIATASFLGRNTASTGDPEVLSIATAKTMLGLTGSNTGDVTLSGETYLSLTGQALTANAVNLSGTHVTSTLPVTKGGTGTGTTFTTGSVVFAGASGVYSQDNANLFWDDSNDQLGVGTASPSSSLHVLKTQNAGTVLRVDNADNTGNAAYTSVAFYQGGTLRAHVASINDGFSGTTGGAGALQIWNVVNTNMVFATNNLERVRIQGDGRVGINLSPTAGYQLDVGGALRVSSDLFLAAATANIYLKDTSTGWVASTTTVMQPQANNALRSTTYTSGLVGWNISALGNAEFNNVDVRGAIHAAIFTYNAINATAGTLGVFKSAAKLRTDVTVPAGPTYGTTTVSIDVVDAEGLTHAASQLFVVNDILRLKDGLIGDTWFKVSSVSDQTTFWRYTSIIMAGTANVTYRAGMGVPDYGISGQGFIIQTADQTNSPYLQMATHAATFSSSDANGTLTLTPRMRLGNLNGSYGYASDLYGFGTGEYGVASKAWVTVEQTNGIRMGSNVTTRISLNPNGSGFLANSAIAWDTSGNLTVTANATIAGWTVNSTSLSNGGTHIAAGVDAPGSGTIAWFGQATSFGGFRGMLIRDSSARSINLYAGQVISGTELYPYMQVFDGTRARVVVGGLNFAHNADGSTSSMGMKVWDASGNLLVRFADTNIIAGWTISSTKISSTGIDIHSGASAALAFGATPPTSASAGTGIWLDRTGLFGLSGGTVQAKVDATNGKITAAAGNVILDSRGVNIQANIPAADDDYAETSAVNFRDSTTLVSGVYHSISTSKGSSLLFLETVPLASNDSRIELSARAATSKAGRIRFTVSDNNGGTEKTVSMTTSQFVVNPKLTIGTDTFNMATTKTPASAAATGTAGDWCWDTGFIYICVGTNAWKRVVINSW